MFERLTRIGLVVLGAPAALIGVWAAFAPRSFYDDFPGLGRMWVAPDGPFNEHLVRDVGALNLALAIVTIAAAVTLSRTLTRWVLVAWLLEGLLHVGYHVRHLAPFDASDAVSIVASLALVPIIAGGLLLADVRRRPEPG